MNFIIIIKLHADILTICFCSLSQDSLGLLGCFFEANDYIIQTKSKSTQVQNPEVKICFYGEVHRCCC